MSASFTAWLFDPRRSLEERFGGELLVEENINRWRHNHGVKIESNYEADRLRKRRRSLNPAYQPVVSQADAEEMARRLAREEGIFAGISSGGAVAVALRISRELKNSVIVTIICDRGDRYLSTGVFPD